MKYKLMENINYSPSLLGFGCMRFPTIKNEEGKRVIDFNQTKEMIAYALKNGVTYIDTAYPYHGGESERVVGEIMKDYDRSSFTLATKLPMWALEKEEDIEKIFNEQLTKLQTNYVDFYLLHALNKDRIQKIKDLKILEHVKKLKDEGKIKHIGFSFHDSYEVFDELIHMFDWEFCQIQLNYMDTEIQAGLKGLKLAESMGIPVVVMEPIKGGFLSKFSPDVEKVFKDYDKDASISSWALRYVASLNNVKVVLSGMSNFDQVKDNIETFADFKEMNEEELAVVSKAKALIESKVKNGCTGCRYCMPCPNGVNIPWNFRIWNEASMYSKDNLKWEYDNQDEKMKANNCVGCGKCEKMCPQHISIREDLKKVYEFLNNGRKNKKY